MTAVTGLVAWLVIDSGLGPLSFLIAPPTMEANDSARTYRSRPLHPRHFSPIFATIASVCGNEGGNRGLSQ
jgi:hypothetical protein